MRVCKRRICICASSRDAWERVVVSLICMRVLVCARVCRRARACVCARVADSIHITNFYSFFYRGSNRLTLFWCKYSFICCVIQSNFVYYSPFTCHNKRKYEQNNHNSVFICLYVELFAIMLVVFTMLILLLCYKHVAFKS